MSKLDFPDIEALIEPQLVAFAKLAYANFDQSHDFNHALLVWRNVDMMLRNSVVPIDTWNRRIVDWAAVLHDTYDYKYAGVGLPVETIQAFIRQHLYADADICIHIIENMSWSKRHLAKPLAHNDWMRLLVQSADWLEALGDTGLHRCITYTLKTHPDASMEEVRVIVKQHIVEKILNIRDAMPPYAQIIVDLHRLNAPIERYLRE